MPSRLLFSLAAVAVGVLACDTGPGTCAADELLQLHGNAKPINEELTMLQLANMKRQVSEASKASAHSNDAQATVRCSVEAETSTQSRANTRTGASVQFSVDGVWLTPRVIAKSMSYGEVVTADQTLPGRPQAIRIVGTGDGWGYVRLSVSCGDETWVLLDSSNGDWVDTDSPDSHETASHEYEIPSQVRCSVEAETSTQSRAKTRTGASVQFSVDGVWLTPRVIAESMSYGEVVTADQTLPGPPQAIRIVGTGDGWGYVRLSVSCGDETWVLLDSSNGDWVDTDSPDSHETSSHEYEIQ